MEKIIAALSFFLIFSNAYSNNSDSLFSQNNTEIKDTTIKCTVVTVSKVTYKEVNLFGLRDSTVNILKDNKSKEIFIKDIHSIKFNGAGIWKNAAYGAGIWLLGGFLVGVYLIDSTDNGKVALSKLGDTVLAGIGFAVVGSLIGGVIGALGPKDHFYNLRKLDFEEKRKKVKNIIKKHSDR